MDPQKSAGEAPGTRKGPEPTQNINIQALLADLERSYPLYLGHFRAANPGPYATPTDPKPASFCVPPASPPSIIAMEEDEPVQIIQKRELHSRIITGPPAQIKISRNGVATGPSAQQPRTGSTGPSTSTGPSAPPAKAMPKGTPSPGPSAQKPVYVKEVNSETSPASSEKEDFTVVQSKTNKRKLNASNSKANPPKKVGLTPTPANSQATPQEKSEDSPMEGPRREKVPPLYIREKLSWQRMLPMLAQQNICFVSARSTAIGIRVDCPSSVDHRRLTALLRQENIGFHTYALQDERVLRVVVRGLPKELDCNLIKEDLLSQGLPVQAVHRMYNQRTKLPYEMVLVILDLSPEGKEIYNLKSVCRLSGLRVEAPKNKGTMGQCHRCQMYGHSARNCYAQPRCVKCLGDHGTSDCQRTADSAEPPSCVLCRTQGHPANYRGCSKAPKGRQNVRKAKPTGPKAAAPPAPAFVPAPAPAVNAWDRPLYRVNPLIAQVPLQAAALPTKPATAVPIPTTKVGSTAADRAAVNYQVITKVLASINIEEMDQFVTELRADPTSAIINHMGLLAQISNLQKTIFNG